jgi:hypothetical protein
MKVGKIFGDPEPGLKNFGVRFSEDSAALVANCSLSG